MYILKICLYKHLLKLKLTPQFESAEVLNDTLASNLSV